MALPQVVAYLCAPVFRAIAKYREAHKDDRHLRILARVLRESRERQRLTRL